MTDETIPHEDNDTPDVADDTSRLDADTPNQGDARPGASANEGAGADSPTGGGDVEQNSDPKAGAGNQQVDDPKESAGQHQEKG
jgi:hypothetical protein